MDLGFLEGALLGAGGRVGDQEQSADHTGANGVHHRCGDALGEDQAGRFGIDQDIQQGGDHDPGDRIADDLDQVKGQDVLALEFAFFNLGALESETEDEAGNAAGDHPGPPGGTVLNGVAEGVTNERDQRAGDRAEEGSHERAQAVGGLEAGLRHRGGDLHIHEQQHKERCADANGHDGAGRDFKQVLHDVSL